MKIVWTSFCLMILGALLIFHIFQQYYSTSMFNLAIQPRVMELLSQSMEDQRKLSDLKPEERNAYRARFEEIKELRANYYIMEHSRDRLLRNFQITLTSVLVLILLSSAGFYFWQHRRQRRRLESLQEPLLALSEGQTDIHVSDRGRDTLGSIARMIEKTSGVMARQRRRLKNLDALSTWQEAARRHAHEIRTPLTAARMEVNALVAYVCKRSPDLADRARYFEESVNEELDHLKDFTQAFTSFAKIGKPKLKQTVVSEMLAKYTELFAEAWSNLTLILKPAETQLTVAMDKDMVRQVLVNLCNNSSLAVADNAGEVCLSIGESIESIHVDVADTGPGIPPEIGNAVFKPYTTSRKIGEGMGLGLSIAQKIMLDHGGDLVLQDTGSHGTTFRLIFPKSKEPKEEINT